MPDRPGIQFRWRTGVFLALLAAPVGAAIEIHRDRGELRGQESCVLRVVAPEDGPRRWRWCLRGPDPEGRVLHAEGTTVRFTAPPTGQGGYLTVVVEAADDPFLRAEEILEILPGEGGQPAEAFRPGLHAAALCGLREVADPDPGEGSARQRALAHFRRMQKEIRDLKHRDRALREAAALGVPGAIPVPPEGGRPDPPPLAGTGSRNALPGVFWLTVVGLAALNALEWQAALGQAAWMGTPATSTTLMGRFDTAVQGSLASLGAPCAAALLEGRSIPACSPAYHQSVLALAANVKAQMAQLLTDPEVLGAGPCRRTEESRRQARARIALVQGGWLALYDRLFGAATALQFQLDRDALALEAVAAGLTAARFEVMAVAGNSTALRTAAFVLGETGTSLNLANFVLQSRSATLGSVAAAAQSSRAGYQLYGNNQSRALLDCLEDKPPVEPYPVTAAGVTYLDSPLTALENAFLRISEGCVVARRHALALPVCEQVTAEDFAGHNRTLAELWNLRVPCLTSGQLEGQQGYCPRAPLADSLSRSNTFAWFLKFQAETSGASYAAFALGNGFFAGAQGIVLQGNALLQAGDTALANQAFAGANLLNAVGAHIYENGYDLLRLVGDSRVVVAEITLQFNRESWAELEQKELAAGNRTEPVRPAAPARPPCEPIGGSFDMDGHEPEEGWSSSTAEAGGSSAESGGASTAAGLGSAAAEAPIESSAPGAATASIASTAPASSAPEASGGSGSGTANAAQRTRATPLGWLLLGWLP